MSHTVFMSRCRTPASGSIRKIFDAFITRKPNGMGMGLSISRSIIEAHGGHIWASPAAPYGAIFRFILPTEVAGTA